MASELNYDYQPVVPVYRPDPPTTNQDIAEIFLPSRNDRTCAQAHASSVPHELLKKKKKRMRFNGNLYWEIFKCVKFYYAHVAANCKNQELYEIDGTVCKRVCGIDSP